MAKLSRLAGFTGRIVGVVFVLLLAASFISLWYIESNAEVAEKLSGRIHGRPAALSRQPGAERIDQFRKALSPLAFQARGRAEHHDRTELKDA